MNTVENKENNQQNKIKVVLLSVGGSPEPLKFTLNKYKPEHIWYFCSGKSREEARKIDESLDWHHSPRYIEIDEYEELDKCYLLLRQKIPQYLESANISTEEVVVDYTGGTKPMSAALVLAAIEKFNNFSYIGGKEREKDGLGIVIDGRERQVYLNNPWTGLGIREIEKAKFLWDNYLFEAAFEILKTVWDVVPQRMEFKTVAKVSDAMAARHRLDFKSAMIKLYDALKVIKEYYPVNKNADFIEFVNKSLEICKICDEARADENDVLLRELLDNCIRTAKQKRFEDASARLYRAAELQMQIWLRKKSGNVIIHGKCEGNALPEKLKSLEFCQPDKSGEVKLSLEQCVKALNALGDERVSKIAEDIEKGKSGSKWRKATENRNASILAHGVKAINEEDFETMKEILKDFLGFNLEQESNPIPKLNVNWLQK